MLTLLPGGSSAEDIPNKSASKLVARSLNTRDIFHQMIVDEIRTGRLTAWRRRKIIRYATAMGLTAVEAGEMITSCRLSLEAEEHEFPFHRLILWSKSESETKHFRVFIGVMVLALLAEMAVLHWLV